MEASIEKLSLDGNVAANIPEYVPHRMKIFDDLHAKYEAFVAQQPRSPIKITLPDGRIMDGIAWETTPFQIAKLISNSLADRLVIAKVNGELFDTTRPFEGDCALQLIDFENDEGKAVFWHSSAHVLGEACEKLYGCHLCLGPPTEDGFFYEMGIKDRHVTKDDYPMLNDIAKSIIKEKQKFIRLEVPKADLLEMFKHNPYKVHIINDKIPDGTSTTVYRCGPLIDLCRGPHIPDTGRIKAFQVMKNSGSYFLGKAENDALQRIYGVSFPDNKLMKEYLKFLEEADKRDHRKLGKDQQLFFFHELSPGSCFFLPHGARIYNTLQQFIRSEYSKRGFTEVISPNVYNVQLWHKSGHWDNYKENMFSFEVEKETFALKPMNCPGHCIMFNHRDRSYRELPIRFADFGVLHRNELSGALSGLTRVRRFQQDDAHIFCREDQIEQEMRGCLDFLKHVYGIFGFSFTLKLSTRPEKFLGAIETWDRAEAVLEKVLIESGMPWELNSGDGAFYGPKIDITVQDAHRRRHQCATIQLDFQLPIRFQLQFRKRESGDKPEGSHAQEKECGQEDQHQCQQNQPCEHEQKAEEYPDKPRNPDMERPVMIHRAVLGSLERMIAVLTENYGGNWPFWLSPRQIAVIPVSHAADAYAERVTAALHDAGFYVDVDLSDQTLNKKIRNAEVAQYNFILVVGAQEEAAETVNVRKCTSDGKDKLMGLKDCLHAFQALKDSKVASNVL